MDNNTHTIIEFDYSLECPICFEYLENDTINNKTSCCKQLIHEECLNKCLNGCPFCRQKIVNNFPQNIIMSDDYNHNNIHEIEVRISRYLRWRKYFFILVCCFLIGWVPGVLVYQVEQNNILIKNNKNITNYNNNTKLLV